MNPREPVLGKDVDRFLIYGPSDNEIRNKISLEISQKFCVDFSKIVPMHSFFSHKLQNP